MDNFWLQALWSLAPTVLVGLLFWFIMRAILRADSKEREAYDAMFQEYEKDARESDDSHPIETTVDTSEASPK